MLASKALRRIQAAGPLRWLVALTLIGMTIALPTTVAVAQSSVRPPGESHFGPNTAQGGRSTPDTWRDIRQGKRGTVVFPSAEGGVLIQSGGEVWRVRHGTLARYGAWLLLAAVGIAGSYFVVRGRISIRGGRTGRVVPRFSLVERIVHWFVAVLFVLLATTGLVLLFGRYALLPIIGPEAFALVASAAMQAHNLFGPLFIPALVALCVTFVRGNGYRGVDLKWLVKGGGFIGGHASSHKYNFGEKSWFWWSLVMGLVLSASGIALLFPIADRSIAQLAILAHAAAALLFIVFAIGHIYLGTIGMEGALEGMTRGTVDENWAKHHHDPYLCL